MIIKEFKYTGKSHSMKTNYTVTGFQAFDEVGFVYRIGLWTWKYENEEKPYRLKYYIR